MTAPSSQDGSPPDETGLPTYVKALLALAVLTIVFIIVLDLLVIAGSL